MNLAEQIDSIRKKVLNNFFGEEERGDDRGLVSHKYEIPDHVAGTSSFKHGRIIKLYNGKYSFLSKRDRENYKDYRMRVNDGEPGFILTNQDKLIILKQGRLFKDRSEAMKAMDENLYQSFDDVDGELEHKHE